MTKRSSSSRRRPRPSSSAAAENSYEYDFWMVMETVELGREDIDLTVAEDDEAVRSPKKRTTTTLTKRKKKQKKKIDSLKPKKPASAFFYFLEDFRKVYRQKNPNIINMSHIGKAGGEKWKAMTYEEKVQYYDIATEKRSEFDRAMSEYNKKQEASKGQQSGDSEYDELEISTSFTNFGKFCSYPCITGAGSQLLQFKQIDLLSGGSQRQLYPEWIVQATTYDCPCRGRAVIIWSPTAGSISSNTPLQTLNQDNQWERKITPKLLPNL
ncbi:High mobility group B protein 14-like protein [Drosera capensis]